PSSCRISITLAPGGVEVMSITPPAGEAAAGGVAAVLPEVEVGAVVAVGATLFKLLSVLLPVPLQLTQRLAVSDARMSLYTLIPIPSSIRVELFARAVFFNL